MLKSAEEIIPEFQKLKIGDGVLLHPKAPPLEVRVLIPEQSLVLGQGWGFHLVPSTDSARTTRLISRTKGGYEPRVKNRIFNFIVWHVFYEPIHFVMQRGMLKGIKRRAERIDQEVRTE